MPVKTSNVRTVSPGGQISLGKKFAGRQVIIDEVAEGVWTIKTAITIPENELWMHTEPGKTRVDEALRWAASHEPEASNLDELETKLMKHLENRERGD
ncbi:MAG: hypothetical protein HC933_16285 [Pleurocapsa sp. SU_196_0]|nr:hypothetical protein [Pleurocapsa sp. SU_196_0]